MTSATEIPTVTLNDENTMPVVGLGVGELSDEDTELAVTKALESGYRLIDTAAAYGNEAAVGRAIVASGVPRSELFVTTKLATQDQGYTTTRTAFEASLERLGLDYVDMYMIHWPAAELGKYVDSFGALMVLHDDALIRSMGVCNFTPEHLSNVIELSYTTPAVNQIELHPLLNQAELRAFHAENGIVTEAYCPLGIGKLIDNSAVTSIASAHGRTPAQVLLRWNLQLGNVVIPRSSSPERIAQNIDVFDFELTGDEMVALDALNDGTRFRQDPETYTGT